jgi:hypothetical protein
MAVEIRLHDEDVENYLIDKACKLNTDQRKNLKKLFNKLAENPEAGEHKTIPIPVNTKYYITGYLGKKIHMNIYYDLETGVKSSSRFGA